MISIDYHFRLHQILKKNKNYFTPKQTEHKNIVGYEFQPISSFLIKKEKSNQVQKSVSAFKIILKQTVRFSLVGFRFIVTLLNFRLFVGIV